MLYLLFYLFFYLLFCLLFIILLSFNPSFSSFITLLVERLFIIFLLEVKLFPILLDAILFYNLF